MYDVLSRFFFSSRRRHTRWPRDWSSDVCSSDLGSHHSSKGRRQKVMAMVWTMVLALPARFAGNAPYFRIVNRIRVIPNSRTRIRIVIHHGTYSHTDSMIRAAPEIGRAHV